MDTLRSAPLGRLAAGLAIVASLAACSAAGATASPSDAMMDHSPAPSAMAAASPSASDAMMDHSPAPSAMASTPAPVSSGTFHAVDGSASGTAALFHNADGSFTITFEDFSIADAAGIHVVLVPGKDVKADADVDKTTIIDLGALKGTSGMQDFAVPATADAMTYHSVVLWDTGMAHAIAAAPLQ